MTPYGKFLLTVGLVALAVGYLAPVELIGKLLIYALGVTAAGMSAACRRND